MAEPCYPSIEQLRNFGVDSESLSTFINGDAGQPNLNRKGVDIETVETWRERVIDIAQQAADMQTYLTKDDADAAQPQPEGSVAQVTNDPDPANNGYWVSDGAEWIYSGLQPAKREDVLSLQARVSVNELKIEGKASAVEMADDEIGGGLLSNSKDRTWLLWRTSDGGPPEFVAAMLRERLGVPDYFVPEGTVIDNEVIGGGLLAAGKNNSWLLWRKSDGGPPESVVQHLRERIGTDGLPGLNFRVHPSDGELVPTVADMSKWAIWGSSSAWYMAPLIAQDVADLYGAEVYGFGVSGQKIAETCAQLGSHPAQIQFPGNEIPAAGTVTVTASNVDLNYRVNYAGEIAGVKGVLYKYNPEDPITFTRSDSGEAVSLAGDELFYPDNGLLHRNSFVPFWSGKNDTSGSGDTEAIVAHVVKYTKEAIQWLGPLASRALVLGHFVNRGVGPTSRLRVQVNRINAEYKKYFKVQYVGVYEWLLSPQVWIDMGMTPTQQDLDDQANGIIPEPFMRDNGHLTDAMYIGVFQFPVRRQLETILGWYIV